MAKHIPTEIVQRYIQLDTKIEKLEEEYEKIKGELRSYHEKGYESDAITFKESTQWRPDWKTLVHELVKKYMTPTQARLYLGQKLLKRFPRKPCAPTIVIVGKERKSHKKEEVEA